MIDEEKKAFQIILTILLFGVFILLFLVVGFIIYGVL